MDQSSASQEDLTPEQIKRFEINRLKAKARQRTLDATLSSSSHANENNKRPLEVVSSNSRSPTAPKPLKRDSRLGKYFEYDLSKMVNSKGGFLVEDDQEVTDNQRTLQRQKEREKAMAHLDPPLFLDNNLNPKCTECQSVDIDQQFLKVFKCCVCHKCKQVMPEKYSLLTKTECKEDYLLTDRTYKHYLVDETTFLKGLVCLAELRDEEELPHLLKANPHHSTFSNMMLYLRMQVEAFAWKKWGSSEALDAEYERRQAEKKRKGGKKFEAALKELRRKTKGTVWQQRQDAEHHHTFGPCVGDQDGKQTQTCTECEFVIEVEEF